MNSTEHVVSTSPFTIRRRVRFGECDPAGVVYTVRFSDYMLSAMELFLAEMLGGTQAERWRALGAGIRIKALRFVFLAPLRPDDIFDMVVRVADVRRSSFDLAVVASSQDGRPAFEATISPICVPLDGERRSVDIPAAFRERLVGYQELFRKAES